MVPAKARVFKFWFRSLKKPTSPFEMAPQRRSLRCLRHTRRLSYDIVTAKPDALKGGPDRIGFDVFEQLLQRLVASAFNDRLPEPGGRRLARLAGVGGGIDDRSLFVRDLQFNFHS